MLLLNFSSCQEEEENVSLKDKHLKNEFVNPYDDCGYHHNKILEKILQESINVERVLNDEEKADCFVACAIEYFGLAQEDISEYKAETLAMLKEDLELGKPAYLTG